MWERLRRILSRPERVYPQGKSHPKLDITLRYLVFVVCSHPVLFRFAYWYQEVLGILTCRTPGWPTTGAGE